MQQFEEKIQEQLPPPTPANQPPPPPPPPPQKTQVIEAPKPANEETPDDARFLSEYDSKVEKQKANHENKYEEMVAKPKPAELTPKETPEEANDPDPAPEEMDPGRDEEAPPKDGALSMRKAGAPERAEAEQAAKKEGATDGKTGPEGDGAPKKGDGAVDQDKKDRTENAEGEGGAGGGKKRAPNLKLDDDTAERIVGGGSVDHTEDVEEGEENAFNTKRWVYASFFNRMKRIVAQNWDPVTVWRREDPDGSHYGFKSRNTILRVSLDAKGNVAKVIILQACGVDSLDDEAIRAMKASDPFPNPPQALLDKNGLIVFEFGFYFEINSKHTSWKIQRSI
jgi:TonB family protein